MNLIGKVSVRARNLLFALPLVCLVAAGCKRSSDEIHAYRVPKNQTPADANAMPDSMPAGHLDVSGESEIPQTVPPAAPQLTWKTPDGWTEGPAGQMRVASFKVNRNGKAADVSVIPLSGMAGGDAANVNRWRGQVNLPDAPTDELQKSAENLEIAGEPAQLFDLGGTNPTNGSTMRILGVIQHRDDGVSWFYKMTGDGDLVEQEKPSFIQFLKSLKFQAATARENPAVGNNPGSQNVLVPDSNTTVSGGEPVWKIPADWKKIPPAQFLLAEFSVGANGAADVNVAKLEGDGGGLLANINRWRGQINLQPLKNEMALLRNVSEKDLPGGGHLALVDFSGMDPKTGKPTRLVGAIVPQSGDTWFYKLMGDEKIVAQQKNAFLQFVESADYR